jgi:6-pyruvoyltetrahydropterin/6-carboxytetrahydropterin synthase
VHVEGPVGDTTGWVMDFADLDAVVAPVVAELDHQYLNEIVGLENPTSERVAEWLWARLQADLPALSQIAVRETCTSAAVLRR